MAFSISNIYKNFFPPKEQSFLGVDIGASSIKIVQLTRKHDRAVLETYGEIALAPYDGKEMGKAMNMPSEKIAEALTDLCREASVTAKQVAIAIPFVAILFTPERQNNVNNRQNHINQPGAGAAARAGMVAGGSGRTRRHFARGGQRYRR